MRLAVFDLDGTVLRGNSWQVFFWWALRRWPLRSPELLAGLVLRRSGVIDRRALQQAALRSLRGADAAAVAAMGERLFEERLRALIRPAARREIAARVADGYEIVFATAAFDFLVAPIARELGVKHLVATQIAFEGGVCAGRTVQPEPRGAVKAGAVCAHFAAHHVDWQQSCAFSDEREDLPLLALVGEPVFVSSARVRPGELPEQVRVENWDDPQ
jgi:putative phosphoserine phosphatase/1-acylglycerol-3-phosphate O-acyltransferase